MRLREAEPDAAYSVPARLAGADPRQDLRRALREAKALLEAGEVLQPDAPPTPHDTPGGKLVGLSDSVPTGWMGADLAGVKPGDVVAVRGRGAVGQMAARAAIPLGAERVISIDRTPERLEVTERHIGSEVIGCTSTDVGAELRERTGGRGPDVCIEAVGMVAHSDSPVHLYDQVKQQLRLQTDRPTALAAGHSRLPQGRRGLRSACVRRRRRQVPPRRGDQQGPAPWRPAPCPWTRCRGPTRCPSGRATAAYAR